MNESNWRSLKSRPIFIGLAIFLVSIWSLTAYFNWVTRDDIEREIAEQQFSTATIVAIGIDGEFVDRMKVLNNLASYIDEKMLSNPASLQAYLEQHSMLQIFFNAGAFVTRIDGTASAEVPSIGRVGVNYIDRDHIASALREGKATVGRPIMGKMVIAPSFAMTVPILDTHNKVIGALAGVTDLTKPNFLDKVSNATFGPSGGYLIIAPQYRIIVTASDKRRVMESLPAVGAIPAMDRMLDGYEGTDIFVNARGVEVMNSAKLIPATGWRAVVSAPTIDALASIHHMRNRGLLAAFVLSLVAGTFTWWTLERQISLLLGFYDPLTKLANRRLLDDRLNQVLASSRRSACCCALMALDLDNFKPVNDKHGHAVGDMLLIEVSRRLAACVREMDTVARTGGDEFMVVLGELNVDRTVARSQAAAIAEKIRTNLLVPYHFKVKMTDSKNSVVDHRCSASIGVVVFKGADVSKVDALKCADMAMYKAKDDGRNRVQFYGTGDTT